ncbi:hypothetical protein L1987_70263 [Smallanthus sonchifolius]|uniref:Uncharacterized protein n=1 Tax=Smallanthus sonchifolius TaxID=185202 RepID=A0ACB9AQ10_9ASTR|nr:hypothetical protein L1987_70263 [Smallanthus sonchifolius]
MKTAQQMAMDGDEPPSKYNIKLNSAFSMFVDNNFGGEGKGITLLLINLDNTTTVDVSLSLNSTWMLHTLKSPVHHRHHHHKANKPRNSKIGGISIREEYHLTAKDGDLHSQVMMLNGKELRVNSYGGIPHLEPLYVNSSEIISVAPFSIVFAHIPHLTLYACSN